MYKIKSADKIYVIKDVMIGRTTNTNKTSNIHHTGDADGMGKSFVKKIPQVA